MQASSAHSIRTSQRKIDCSNSYSRVCTAEGWNVYDSVHVVQSKALADKIWPAEAEDTGNMLVGVGYTKKVPASIAAATDKEAALGIPTS